MQSFYVNGGAKCSLDSWSTWNLWPLFSSFPLWLNPLSNTVRVRIFQEAARWRYYCSLSAKTKRNSFGAVDLVQSNPPPLCLPSSIKSSNPLHEWRGFGAHTSEEKQPKIPERGKKKIALFISPLPLSLFPTLPKVLLGNRSQVFDKPVVDMTAVQSSV